MWSEGNTEARQEEATDPEAPLASARRAAAARLGVFASAARGREPPLVDLPPQHAHLDISP
jgi:hypothetical protein